MTPPRSAEEVAKELLSKLCEVGCCDHPDEEMCPDNRQPALIATALKDYAEGEFERGVKHHFDCCEKEEARMRALGFREGVLKAAKLADENYPLKKASYVLAEDIRALLPPSAEKE
jgi:hypothetical protein